MITAISTTDPFDPGYRFVRRAFDHAEIAALAPILAGIPSNAGGRRWAGRELDELLQSPAIQPVVGKLGKLLPGMSINRAVAFHKDADANWFVPAHQDRSIPVASAALLPGFDNLTRKGNSWQAEAPVAVLQAMCNCRIFIDRATVDDGPLEIIPGSHRRGRIEQADIPMVAAPSAWQPLTGEPGDVALLSPLHRSRRATEPQGRRVLQLECMPTALAASLQLDTN